MKSAKTYIQQEKFLGLTNSSYKFQPNELIIVKYRRDWQKREINLKFSVYDKKNRK